MWLIYSSRFPRFRFHPSIFINDDVERAYLKVQCSLVCEVGLVPSQRYYNIWTGLSLKLFNPVLRPHKWLLANRVGGGGGEGVTQLAKITIRPMWWKDEDPSHNAWLSFVLLKEISSWNMTNKWNVSEVKAALCYGGQGCVCSHAKGMQHMREENM